MVALGVFFAVLMRDAAGALFYLLAATIALTAHFLTISVIDKREYCLALRVDK